MSLLYLAGTSANLIVGTNPTASSEHNKFQTQNLHDGIPGIPFKFNVAAADDTITSDLGSSKQVTFCSVHGHNIDSGITAIQLRKSNNNFSGNDVLVVTMTKATPTFYNASFDQTERYWRLKFVGTNTAAPISIGEWFLGVGSTLATPQRWNWKVELIRPQTRVRTPAGQLYVVNRTGTWNRNLALNFLGEEESDKDEVRDSILEDSKWGEEPLVIVPDSDDEIVIHGRVSNSWGYTRRAASGGGYYTYGLTVEEDPFEVEFL